MMSILMWEIEFYAVLGTIYFLVLDPGLLLMFYAAMEALLAHIYMTTALLQSAFKVFDFDEYCICSTNLENTDLVYTFKNTGIWYFGFGFLFFGLYYLSVFLNTAQLEMVKENQRHKDELYVIFLAIFIEILISIELFIELSFFIKYTTEFANTSNDYMPILVYTSLSFYLLVSYIILIISIIHICSNEDIGEIELALPKPPDEQRPQEARYINTQSILVGTAKTMIDLDTQDMKFCIICLEGMRPEQELLRTTKCRHIFHKACIVQWGERNMSCPMCRTDISYIC